ncbi:LamG-like jellyroll fold domain-containing protein [Halopseudomonas bauzanensis]|uniref:LamG-like jellyroll fold domain-containing protein n=1 Tax=Halopseudomonas bauzanensis TaxID=653930 RepID=UPI002552BF2E|nr:LamG-like jellyroll fold domain-containing protein [Halopseudomonas bauzanensis]
MAETDLWFGTLSATVRVEDLPASRQVVAIERQANGDWRVCGQAVSNAEGIATLPITGLPASRIYAIALDDWGKPFAPGMTVAYGDVIRPTQFLGWMYQVTSPGVLPGTEPEWWNSMAGIPQPVGTAMMQAVRHYQPIAHGPVSDIEWVEQEFDPYWDRVVALLHFDGNLNDEAGGEWAGVGYEFEDSGTPLGMMLKTDVGKYAESQFDISLLDSEPYTLECFLRKQTTQTTATPVSLYQSSSNRLGVYFNDQVNVRAWYNSNVITVPVDMYELHHYALVGMGNGQVRLYVDGVWNGLVVSKAHNVTGKLRLGSIAGGAEPYGGLIGELRVTKGVARYTEDFDPPTAPFPNVGPPL